MNFSFERLTIKHKGGVKSVTDLRLNQRDRGLVFPSNPSVKGGPKPREPGFRYDSCPRRDGSDGEGRTGTEGGTGRDRERDGVPSPPYSHTLLSDSVSVPVPTLPSGPPTLTRTGTQTYSTKKEGLKNSP